MPRQGKRVAITVGAIALIVLAIAVVIGWRDILLFYRFERPGRNAQGYIEYRHRQTGIVMVLLPGGTSLMGAQKTDPNGPNYDPDAQDDEGPVHEVTLRPFLIPPLLRPLRKKKKTTPPSSTNANAPGPLIPSGSLSGAGTLFPSEIGLSRSR